MVLAWCKVLARALRGHLRTEVRFEPLRSWQGEPLPAGNPAADSDSYRTLTIVCVPDGAAISPTTESTPILPSPNACCAGELS
jgi:hypothetical protein